MFSLKKLLCTGLLCLMPIVGLSATTSAEIYLRQVQSELFEHHGGGALAALDEMQMRIDRFLIDADQSGLDRARLSFGELVRHWKALEAIYVAGVMNEDYVDHPRFIDHYHQGHVSIEQTLRPVLQSDKKLARAMFKSSSKSINALEYLLFVNTGPEPRRWQAALVSIGFIRGWLAEIDDFHRTDESFVQAGDKSLGLLVNALVDSSYRLLYWRIGEAAGLAPKYLGKPSPDRLEYYYSGYSLAAIRSILDTHARVFSLGAETGYLSAEGRHQGLEEIAFVRGLIGEAQAAADQLPDGGGDVASEAFAELHRRVEALHKAYYILLVEAMGFEGRIVDADGD